MALKNCSAGLVAMAWKVLVNGWQASIGFEPGYLMALMAGSAEFFGGLALLIGLLTRPAAIVTAFTMIIAMSVHIGNGLFVTNKGYEFALILLAACLSLVFQGAGKLSLDQLLVSKFNDKSPQKET